MITTAFFFLLGILVLGGIFWVVVYSAGGGSNTGKGPQLSRPRPGEMILPLNPRSFLTFDPFAGEDLE